MTDGRILIVGGGKGLFFQSVLGSPPRCNGHSGVSLDGVRQTFRGIVGRMLENGTVFLSGGCCETEARQTQPLCFNPQTNSLHASSTDVGSPDRPYGHTHARWEDTILGGAPGEGKGVSSTEIVVKCIIRLAIGLTQWLDAQCTRCDMQRFCCKMAALVTGTPRSRVRSPSCIFPNVVASSVKTASRDAATD